MQRFKDLKLIYKLLCIGIAAIICFAIGLFGFVLPQFKKALFEQKRMAIQHIVESAVTLSSHYAAEVKKNNLTSKDAKKQALENINQLRFENGNYVFITDTEGIMVLHPAKPELQGKDVMQMQDPNGVYIFKSTTSISKKEGSGFVEYVWPKPGVQKPVGKITYVKLFQPWGWVLGTGVYLDDINKEVSKFLLELFVIFAICGTIAFLAAAMIARLINTPLAKGVFFAEKIAQGDLTQNLDVNQADEIGTLSRALNKMVSNLNKMFKEVTNGVSTLEISSTDLAALSEQMLKNAEATEANAQAVASASEQMSNNMGSVAAASEQASTNVSMVASAAEEMSATVNEIAQNSENARTRTTGAVEQAASASTKVDALGKAANEISKVTEVITEISEQTNLLALNATIEAARAGEAGKGFAVVANEIKELARQTAEATSEIKEKIEGIQTSTTETIDEIDQITKAITDVNEVVNTIASSVEEQSSATAEIADNVMQASQGINEVNSNVAETSAASADITKQIVAVDQSANEIASSSALVNTNAKDLLSLSSRLAKVMAQFTSTEAKFDIAAVKTAHLKWRNRLEEALQGKQSLSPEEVANHHSCEFGRWYESADAKTLQSNKSFTAVGRYHEKVHTLAQKLVKVMSQGDKKKAQEIMPQFEDARIKLFDALDELYLC